MDSGTWGKRGGMYLKRLRKGEVTESVFVNHCCVDQRRLGVRFTNMKLQRILSYLNIEGTFIENVSGMIHDHGYDCSEWDVPNATVIACMPRSLRIKLAIDITTECTTSGSIVGDFPHTLSRAPCG